MGKEEKMKKAAPKMATIPESGDNLDYLYKKNKEDKSMIWKVPGSLAPMGKMAHEKDKERREFKKKSLVELKEMFSRQKQLLGNKSLMSKLPDKGEKARTRMEEILKLIQGKEREDDLTEKMAGLGIGKLIDTDAMEWVKRGKDAAHLDSDDDPDPEDDKLPSNPFKVLASRELPYRQTNQKYQEQTHEEGSIDPVVDPYTVANTSKVDEIQPTSRFMPFASTMNETPRWNASHSQACDKNSPISEDHVNKDNLGEKPPKRAPALNPARRTDPIPLPPKPYTCKTVLLPLLESLELQRHQATKLKEVQMKHAAERLAAGRLLDPVEAVSIADADNYRTQIDDFGSDEEVDSETEGGINVTTYCDGLDDQN